MPDLFDDILPVEPPRGTRGNSFGRLLEEKMTPDDERIVRQLAAAMKIPFAEDVVLELIRRSAPSPNGTRGDFKHTCAGCGREFDSNRRQLPGKRSWCGREECKRVAAAERAKDYRERKTHPS